MRIESWFADNGWNAFAFQHEVRDAYLAGESGLIHSATGSGKTLAAWLGPLQEWIDEGGGSDAPALRVLWITPMRALAGDTQYSLKRVVDGLGLPWTVGIRTGDTPTSERAKQDRRLPSALVTTPESISLLLSKAGTREKLSGLRAVIVDEWHELLGNKRGVQTELALARLRRWNPKLRVWGLSATLGNIDEALERLIPLPSPQPSAQPPPQPSPKGEGAGGRVSLATSSKAGRVNSVASSKAPPTSASSSKR